jgi:hypothetical protein
VAERLSRRGGRKRAGGRPPAENPLDQRVNVSLPREIVARLKAAAAREERTLPSLIRLFIRRGLDEIERDR